MRPLSSLTLSQYVYIKQTILDNLSKHTSAAKQHV